jgi:predicted GIY-YIG superfamily endonuclease
MLKWSLLFDRASECKHLSSRLYHLSVLKLYMQEKGNSGSNGYNEEYSIKELNREKKTI